MACHCCNGITKAVQPAWCALGLHLQATDELLMLPFDKLESISPAFYEDNSKDEDDESRKQTSNNLPQRERVRARKKDRLQDAQDCLVEMAGDAGPALREELR